MRQEISITMTLDELREAIRTTVNECLSEHMTTTQANSDKPMTIDQVCEYIPTKPAKSTIYTMTSKNRIPFYKKGKDLLFNRQAIDKWLEQQQ